MAIEEITADMLANLLVVPKRVVNPQARRRVEERYEKLDYEVITSEGDLRFRVYVRQSLNFPDAFSCGIRWLLPSGETLTLARYNGPNHMHGEIAYECHIHRATEEAIRLGRKPECHAEVTKRYHTVNGALHCLVVDFRIEGLDTAPDQPELF